MAVSPDGETADVVDEPEIVGVHRDFRVEYVLERLGDGDGLGGRNPFWKRLSGDRVVPCILRPRLRAQAGIVPLYGATGLDLVLGHQEHASSDRILADRSRQ